MKNKKRTDAFRALYIIETLEKEFPCAPDARNLSEKEKDFVQVQIQRFRENIEYLGLSCRDKIRTIRNKDFAHQKEQANAEELNSAYKDFWREIPLAKSELENLIGENYSDKKEFRKFEKFSSAFGNEAKRKRFVDALENSFEENVPEEKQIQFDDDKISTAVKSIFETQEKSESELLEFAKNNQGAANSVQNEIIKFVDSLQDDLQKNNPFLREEQFTGDLEKDFQKKQFLDFKKIRAEYLSLDSVKKFPADIDLDFYEKSFSESAKLLEQKDKNGNVKKSAQEKFEKQNEILARNLLDDMKAGLERRKIAWELEQIENARKKFLNQLYEKLAKFKKLMETLKSFTKNFGRLWDLAQGELQDCGFEILEKYSDLLQNDEGLQELAKMIGRHHDEEQKFHKELRAKIVVETIYNPEPAFKGEICGIHLSDSISDALPSQLALYANEKTRAIFKMKFAQKQLFCYDYTRNIEYQKTHEEEEEVEVGETVEQKGPMIICVDTSGSMSGTPERVAKTVAFALSQKSLEEERGCYLISFSTGIETMDLSTFNSTDGLVNLVKFLKMSFNGGTDANPALVHSVKLLEENKTWKNADVLMISDFVMGELDEELSKKIERQKEKKTRFFSLAITSGGNDSVTSAFSKNWIYDTNARDAGAKLVRQLAQMGERTEENETPESDVGK